MAKRNLICCLEFCDECFGMLIAVVGELAPMPELLYLHELQTWTSFPVWKVGTSSGLALSSSGDAIPFYNDGYLLSLAKPWCEDWSRLLACTQCRLGADKIKSNVRPLLGCFRWSRRITCGIRHFWRTEVVDGSPMLRYMGSDGVSVCTMLR